MSGSLLQQVPVYGVIHKPRLLQHTWAHARLIWQIIDTISNSDAQVHDAWVIAPGSLMAEDRPQKIARLANLKGRLPYISQNALASLLKIAETEELPQGSRKTIRQARDAVVHQQTPYVPLHGSVDVQ